MKNELLVRAISEIDPALIEEADAVKPALNHFSARKWSSIAAAFALILTAIIVFAGLPGNTIVSVYDTELSSELSAFPAEITPSFARFTEQDTTITVMIPIEVSADGKTTVKTEDENGYVEIVDGVTGQILKSGNSFEITEDTSFIWYINVSEAATEHKLNIIKGKKTKTVTVNYDFESNSYTAVFSD